MTAVVARRIPPQPLIDAVNPVIRAGLGSPLHRLLDRGLLVLHVTGRRSGRRYHIPVGYVELGDRFLVVTQHGWRANLRSGGRAEATIRGSRVVVRAELDEDPDSVAATCHDVIGQLGWRTARRWLGIVTESGQVPTAADLAQAARDYDLAIVSLTRA
jgi:F420H(2)-dependent quinone reductase